MHDTQRMFEPGMHGAGVDVVRPGQLSYSAESLKCRLRDHLFLPITETNEAVNRTAYLVRSMRICHSTLRAGEYSRRRKKKSPSRYIFIIRQGIQAQKGAYCLYRRTDFLVTTGRCPLSGAWGLCCLPPSPSRPHIMSRLRRFAVVHIAAQSAAVKKSASLRQQNLNPASASVIVQSGGAQRAGVFVVL